MITLEAKEEDENEELIHFLWGSRVERAQRGGERGGGIRGVYVPRAKSDDERGQQTLEATMDNMQNWYLECREMVATRGIHV